jgi:uncharacterized protein (TIGR02118 family)
MIVRMGLLQRKAGLEAAEFRSHWRNVHGPLATKLPGLRRYHQNHVVDRQQRGISYARGAYDFDGISELWFDDLPTMQGAFSTNLVNELGADESTFIGDLKLITAIQHQVLPVTKGERLIKRMSTLKRRPDISAEKFQREWFDVHSELVKRLPEVKGYTQNLIFDRSHGRGRPLTYDEFPVDGIVELWFRDTDELESGFRSPSGKTLMTHAEEFIAEISTFLVESHEIVEATQKA